MPRSRCTSSRARAPSKPTNARWSAMTSANLGIIANIRGDFAEALHHYSAGLENYRALDRRSDVVVALNNMGRLHTDLRQWPEAERAYAEAIDISNAIGDQTARIGLEVNVADMRLARGDASRAAVAFDNAVMLTTETGDTAWAAHIAKLRGMLHRAAGAITEAEQQFDRAVELSESRQDLLLLAETLRERAELYQSEGRNRETLQNLNRAHRLFTQLRAKRELANVDRSVVAARGRLHERRPAMGRVYRSERPIHAGSLRSRGGPRPAPSPRPAASTGNRCSGFASARSSTTSASWWCHQRS